MAGLPCNIEAFPRWLAALFFLRTVDRYVSCTGILPFRARDGNVSNRSPKRIARRTTMTAKDEKATTCPVNFALRDVETQDHRSSRGRGEMGRRERGKGRGRGWGHNLRYEIINRTVYVYSICVRMYLYIVRPQGAAVWHNHDLKSDQLISCIRIYVVYTFPFFFFPHYATPATNVI